MLLVAAGCGPAAAPPRAPQRLAEADLVIMNGLGLDDWLADMIESVSGGPQSRVPIVRLAEDGVDYELLPGEEPDTRNPHLWMDVSYPIQYVERIETPLAPAAPSGGAASRRSSLRTSSRPPSSIRSPAKPARRSWRTSTMIHSVTPQS